MYFPELLKEYKQLLVQMRSDGVTSGDLYREVQQAIQWMETGYDPAEVRAKNRVDAYTMDPYHMQTFMHFVNDQDMLLPEQLQTLRKKIISRWMPEENNKVRADEFIRRHFADFNWAVDKVNETKETIVGALNGLTDNEKAAFIAVEAEKIPYTKVAAMLGVEKGTQDSLFDDIA